MHPCGGLIGHGIDAGRIRCLHPAREGERRVCGLLCLERDGTGGDAAVEFRQGDLHGEIGGGQTRAEKPPTLLRAACRNGLQDRAIGFVEHEICIVAG